MSKQKAHTPCHVVFLALIFLCAANIAHAGDDAHAAETLGFKLIRVLPHDVTHYTQGLFLHDGLLYESAGRYGRSALYQIELKSGRVRKTRKLDDIYFAEGIALTHQRIVQLTWREQTALIYDSQLNPQGSLHYDGEGWGLASVTSADELVMSDGSSRLRFLDGSNFHLLRTVNVHDGARDVYRLNELEMVRGLILANIWLSDDIAVIDPADGAVVAWLDLSALKDQFVKPPGWSELEHVLNGIAYDDASGHLFVTGKCWPSLFEIRVDRWPTLRAH